jgi:hypothetical protein
MKWGTTEYFEFTENADSPREQNAVDGAQRTQIVDVVPGDLASRDQATLDFLGYANVQNVISRVDPTKRVNYIHRQTPLAYARRPLDVFQKLNRPRSRRRPQKPGLPGSGLRALSLCANLPTPAVPDPGRFVRPCQRIHQPLTRLAR